MTRLTAIENHLMQLDSIHYINRRENPGFTGSGALPAVRMNYGYSSDGQTPISRQADTLDLELTTDAVDKEIGSADIDAHDAIDQQIFGILDGWKDPADPDGANSWRRVAGGDVSRETGFCRSVIRYRREVNLSACEV